MGWRRIKRPVVGADGSFQGLKLSTHFETCKLDRSISEIILKPAPHKSYTDWRWREGDGSESFEVRHRRQSVSRSSGMVAVGGGGGGGLSGGGMS